VGLFDLFSGKSEKKAADAARRELEAGRTQSLGAIDGGLALARPFYEQAGHAFDDLDETADGFLNDPRKGSALYSDALGINGAEGAARAGAAFTKGPGYEFNLNETLEAGRRAAAARGALFSGNTDADLMDRATGLASREHNGWLDRLSGVADREQSLRLSGAGLKTAVAGGRAGVLTGAGQLEAQGGNNKAAIYSDTSKGVAQAASQREMADLNASSRLFGTIMGGLNLVSGGMGRSTGAQAPAGEKSKSIFGSIFG
jgi:hypothetical protein